MRLALQYGKLIWLIGLLLSALAVGTLLEKKLNSNTQRQLTKAYAEAQQVIIDKEIASIQLLQGGLIDTINLSRNWSEIIYVASLQHLHITVFKNDTLLLWSNNLLNAGLSYQKQPMGAGFAQLANGYYFTYKQQRGSYTYLFAYLIQSNYSFRNQFIENTFSDELSFIKEGFVVGKPLEGFTAIKDLSGQYLCSLQIFSFSDSTPLWLIILLSVFILALIITTHITVRHYIQQFTVLTSFIFISLLVLFRWLSEFYHIPDFVYELELFDPVIYASSVWFPSLGDLLINSALVLWYLVLLESKTGRKFDQAKAHPGHYWAKFITAVLVCILAAHTAIGFIKSITIDSQISFNINNVFTINFFTYTGLVVCIIILLCIYFMVRNVTRFVKNNEKPFNQILLITVGLLLTYTCFAYFFVEKDLFHIGVAILLLLLFAVFRSLKIKLNRFQQYFVVIFIIAFVSSISINHWVGIKEIENRKLFASKLTSQNDITTDYFLRNVEKKIIADAYIKDYFVNPLIIKSQFEKRIRQLYFTGYLSKYEVSVFDYDSIGYFFKQKNNFTYQQINKLYNTKSVESINSHFRHLSNASDIKGYLAKFVIRLNGLKVGYIFILLQPKLIQDENRFDELLIDGFRQSKRKLADYSYAVYKDKNLVFQSGDYPYRIKNTWGETNNDFKSFTENGYDHLLHTDTQPLTIIISKQSDSLLQVIGLFSFIFTFCTMALLFILFMYIAMNTQFAKRLPIFNHRVFVAVKDAFNRLLMIEKPDVMYIRTRIQSSIIFIVFITLLFTSYFTITFITQKYNNRQTERLMKKLRNVVLTIENENINDYEFNDANELGAFINQIADFYDTDITLYNDMGKVMASSIGKIYDEGVVSDLMEPIAFYHLHTLKESQYTQEEHIALLEFQAAYAPVFKNKSEVLGYLQLPYFSQQADLLAEISSVIVGFINLYVVLFLIIGVIAYLVSRNISYPLTLIQQKLSRTVLGEKNEPLSWQRDDEIGELVKQYNHMIEQLEQSAQKLAETEREGAWREIARQIAHEIKNPLTPMKLSIQHLQRAFKNNDANIGDKLDRTTSLLINQIDTLSELANEFSSFAKMPAPNYEPIDVKNAISEIVDLYSVNTSVKIEWQCSVQSELYYDRSYFSRSIGNIVKNAIQAIPEHQENGMVEIQAYEDTEMVYIHVKDNGAGMNNEQASQIFKPYFSTKISGMGLGLPIVKNMIESGKGTISFVTKPDEGTTFTVIFPKHIAQ